MTSWPFQTLVSYDIFNVPLFSLSGETRLGIFNIVCHGKRNNQKSWTTFEWGDARLCLCTVCRALGWPLVYPINLASCCAFRVQQFHGRHSWQTETDSVVRFQPNWRMAVFLSFYFCRAVYQRYGWSWVDNFGNSAKLVECVFVQFSN